MFYSPMPYCKETPTNSKKLRIDESPRTSLTWLHVILRNLMFVFIFTLMNPVVPIFGGRHGFLYYK